MRGWYKEGGGGDYGYWGWDYKDKGSHETIPMKYMVDPFTEKIKGMAGQIEKLQKDVAALPDAIEDFQGKVDGRLKSLNGDIDAQKSQITREYTTAFSGVQKTLDDFTKVTYAADLKALRTEINDKIGKDVEAIRGDLDAQITALSEFKAALQGAVNSAARASVDAMVQGPPTNGRSEPRISTTRNGAIDIETPHEHITVNQVEIPNVDDMVATINHGVSSGFEMLSEAMDGL